MSTWDRVVSVHPYWTVSKGKMDEFRRLCQQFVSLVESEPKCLYYDFSFNGDEVFCREAYINAEALLQHLSNIGPLLTEALNMARMTRLEVHAAEPELAKLREPLSGFNPTYFTVLYGIRR